MGLLRVYLALSVIITHNGNSFFGSDPILAVPAFFVISGFVIALVLNEKYVGNTPGFLLARHLRLWPSYAVVIAIVFAFFSAVKPIPDSPVANIYLYCVSIGLWFYDTLGWFTYDANSGAIMMLDGSAARGAGKSIVWRTPMAHMWSVGVELTFYLVAPLLARRWKYVLAAFLVALVVHILIVLELPQHHPLRAKSAINSFYLFAAGMLSYWFWVHKRWLLDRFSVPAIPLAACAGFMVLWAGQPLARIHPLAPDLVLLCFAVSLVPVFHYSRDMRWDRSVGELSYGIYLVHWPILHFLLNGHSGQWLWTGYIALASLAASVVLQLIIVNPIDRIRKRLAVPVRPTMTDEKVAPLLSPAVRSPAPLP